MKKRILVVDDEKSIVRLLSIRLHSQNYEVLTAYDGSQCVKVAKAEKPDLILLDIKMPSGSGIKAFENLQNFKETKDIPVIFITAYPKPELKDLVFEMGATGFVTKPFNGELLMSRIKKVFDGSNKKSGKKPQNKNNMELIESLKKRFSLDYN